MRGIDLLVNTRRLAVAALESLSPETRRAIPAGFTNNVLWHAGHLMVTQQILCYKLSGLPMAVDAEELRRFAKGSSPADWDSDPDDSEILEKLALLPQKLRDDLIQGLFTTYEPYETSTGFVIASIEDAIAFNNFHEGVHLGIMRAMVKSLKG